MKYQLELEYTFYRGDSSLDPPVCALGHGFLSRVGEGLATIIAGRILTSTQRLQLQFSLVSQVVDAQLEAETSAILRVDVPAQYTLVNYCHYQDLLPCGK